MAVAEDPSYEEEEDDRRRSGRGSSGRDSTATPELERGILFFIISLLDHVVRGWEYESPIYLRSRRDRRTTARMARRRQVPFHPLGTYQNITLSRAAGGVRETPK